MNYDRTAAKSHKWISVAIVSIALFGAAHSVDAGILCAVDLFSDRPVQGPAMAMSAPSLREATGLEITARALAPFALSETAHHIGNDLWWIETVLADVAEPAALTLPIVSVYGPVADRIDVPSPDLRFVVGALFAILLVAAHKITAYGISGRKSYSAGNPFPIAAPDGPGQTACLNRSRAMEIPTEAPAIGQSVEM